MSSPAPESASLRVLAGDSTAYADAVVLCCPERCDGSMTCICPACRAEVAARVRRGVRPSRQPWDGGRAA